MLLLAPIRLTPIHVISKPAESLGASTPSALLLEEGI